MHLLRTFCIDVGETDGDFTERDYGLIGWLDDLVARVAPHMLWLFCELQVVHVLHQVLGVVASEVPVLPRRLVHHSQLATLHDAESGIGRSGLPVRHSSTKLLRLEVRATIHRPCHVMHHDFNIFN